MGRSYENRIVAFVDMLGTSDRVLADSTGKFTNAVHKVVSAMSGKHSTIWLMVPHVGTGKAIPIQFDRPFERADRMTTLSDGIVMSFPAIERANELAKGSKSLPILRCLEAVFWLQRGFLSVGLRTRGGICRGRLVHTNNFVYGEGMVRAYRLESRVAVFPRTVIDQDVVDTLLSEAIPKIILFENRIAHMVRVDQDGRYFVDYLGYDPIQGGASLSDRMRDIYEQTVEDLKSASDPKILEKLQWLKRYIVCTAEEMAGERSRLEANSNSTFGSKFQRSSDNLISYAKRASE